MSPLRGLGARRLVFYKHVAPTGLCIGASIVYFSLRCLCVNTCENNQKRFETR